MARKTKKLHYLNTNVFRIADNMLIQGGDIINNDGTGGASIYGQTFVDENFSRRHACAGLLSMASRGRNTNNS
jgi:cyclophilin family peptidyl-prolyl cis-trans isomerase